MSGTRGIPSGLPFPEGYGEDVLYAMVRDSQSVYAYWEITDRRWQLYESYFGSSWRDRALFLHAYCWPSERASGGLRVYDSVVPPGTRDWVVHRLTAGYTYRLALGIKSKDKPFVPVLCSHIVRLPGRALLSDGPTHEDHPAVWWDAFMTYRVYQEMGDAHATDE